MSIRLVAVLIFSSLTVFLAPADASEWSIKHLEAYIGDYNADGQADIYLKAVDVSVAGVPKPIVEKAPFKSRMLLREGYSYVSIYEFDDARLANTDWLPAPYKLEAVDVDGDQLFDLVMQPNESSGELLVVSAIESKKSIIYQGTGQSMGADIAASSGAKIEFLGKSRNGKLFVRVTHPLHGSDTLLVDSNLTSSAMPLVAKTSDNLEIGDAPESYSALNLTLPEVSVGLGGDAQYSLPIAAPAGINGMQPALSVTYVGLGQNGVLGRGWGLGGLSTIQRCASTIVQDGANIPVALAVADKLCLDGMRLQLISGQYLQVGSVYRTELDGFNRITLKGSDNALTFEIKTRAGETLQYGGGNATINSKGKVAEYIWAIKSRTDGFGNAVQYSYEVGASSVIPTQISYSDIVVSFVYQTLPYTLRQYRGGGYSETGKVISALDVKAAGAQAMRYQLSYNPALDNPLYSVLSSVQACQWGSEGKACQQSVAFSYLKQALQWMPSLKIAQDFYVTRTMGPSFVPVDWNGDGAKEFARSYFSMASKAARIGLIKSNGSTLTEQVLFEGNQFPVSLGRFDFDGDGTEELYYFKIISSSNNNAVKTLRWFALTKNGEVPISDAWQTDGTGVLTSYAPGLFTISMISGSTLDANNDGRDDLLLPVSGQWSVFLNSGNTQTPTFTKVNWLPGFTLAKYPWLVPLGLDPSGGVQLITQKAGVLHGAILKNGVALSDSSLVSMGVNADRAVSADVNGDGLPDYVVQGANSTLSVLLNTGASPSGSMFQRIDTPYSSAEVLPLYKIRSAAADYPAKALDHDGDGAQEIIYPGQDALFYLLRFTGSTFERIATGIPVSRAFHSDVSKLTPNCRQLVNESRALIADHRRQGNTAIADSLEYFFYIGTAITCGYNYEGVKIDPFEMFPADYTGKGVDEVLLGTPVVEVSYGTTRLVGQQWQHFAQARQYPELLSKVDNGAGNTVEINYGKLNDTAIHTPATNVAFPDMAVRSPKPVVSTLLIANGVGGQASHEYKYRGARLNRLGRGFLGFASIEAKDLARNQTRTRTLRQDFPFIGAVSKDEIQQDSQLISRTTQQWEELEPISGKTYYPYVAVSTQEQFEGGAVVAVSQSTQTHDTYGNAQSTITRTASTVAGLSTPLHTISKTRSFNNDESQWLLGFLASETTQSSSSGQSRSRTHTYTAVPGTLAVASEVRYAGAGAAQLSVSYGRDGAGRVVSTTETTAGQEARTSTQSAFQGPWPTSQQNALGHTQSTTYDRVTGNPLTVTDANGLITTYSYDAFGRETQVSRPGGATELTTYSICGGMVSCPAGAVAAIRKRTVSGSGLQGAPEQWTYLDQLARAVRERHQGYDGGWINTDSQFDALGRLIKQSEPYSGATPNYLLSTWDNRDRPLTRQLSGGAALSFTYGSRTEGGTWRQYTLTYEAGGAQSRTERRESNALGQLEVSINAVGSSVATSVRYLYDPDGNLAATRVNGAQATDVLMTYDVAGNRISLQDPNSGLQTMSVDGFGQIGEVTASDGSKIRQRYDRLGRMVRRQDINPQGGTVEESIWTYDSAPNGIGKLAGMGRTDQGFMQVYSYDELSRPYVRKTTIQAAGQTLNYTDGQVYDGFNRPHIVQDASGFRYVNDYNGYGYASGETDFVSGKSLRTINSQNERGQITRVTYGNGVVSNYTYTPGAGWLTSLHSTGAVGTLQDLTYTYGQNGVLLARDDGRGYKETFSYDLLNRLTSSTRTLADGQTVHDSYVYDGLGNLLQSPHFTSLSYGQYDAAGQSACGNGVTPGPHAVLRSNAGDYCYDSRGNQLSGPGRTVSYSLYDKPLRISTSNQHSDFSYDPERRRYLLVSGSNRGTVYLDEGRFEEHLNGSQRWQNSYIGDYLQVQRNHGSSQYQLHYQLRDQLGSLESVTDANGALVERRSYAPFGGLRGADWSDSPAVLLTTRRGFTDHEHLPDSGLIHMNGRVYDPTLGRFLSADIVYQDTTNGQAFNRYSYGFNSPFSGVDPTGYALEEAGAPSNWFQLATQNMGLVFYNLFAGNAPSSWFDVAIGGAKSLTNGGLQIALMTNPQMSLYSKTINSYVQPFLEPSNIDQRYGDGLIGIGGLATGLAGSFRVLAVRTSSNGLTIAANPAIGNPAAIFRGFGTLNSRQSTVLEQLPEFGSSTIAHKSFGQRDLSALTAATGDEFAMFSVGGRRLIFRGDSGSVPITPDMASQLASQGWRWSLHTHPGGAGVLRSSIGDRAVLEAMGGQRSSIFNSMGQRSMFTPRGDSLQGWMP